MKKDSVNREPAVLVIDGEVQMLPWENIPILTNDEVYRMPSVCSIRFALGPMFSSIDPLNAYYLVNPGGNLQTCQDKFEERFRDKKLQGVAGFAPTMQELAGSLKKHDLFIYYGHGNGER